MPSQRRFPPPWTVEELSEACFVVKDVSRQKLGYFYYEEEPGRRSTAKMLTKDEARRIAANVAKLPELFAEGVMPTQQSRRCRVSRRLCLVPHTCRLCANGIVRVSNRSPHGSARTGGMFGPTDKHSIIHGVAHKQRSLAICYVRSDVG
jgi:hypothetical protein